MQNENVFLLIKTAWVGAAAAFSAAFGWLGWLVLCWIGCMVLDYLTGTAAACKAQRWSSKAAREGAWHKVGMIIVVVSTALADMVLGAILKESGLALPIQYTMLLSPVVILWYIVTELGSVAENAADMGAPVPKLLVNLLLATKEKVEDLEVK